MRSVQWSRREFLRAAGAVGTVASVWNAGGLERVEAASQSVSKMTAEEVARVIVFLASEMSSYVTGQVIGVDGGMII